MRILFCLPVMFAVSAIAADATWTFTEPKDATAWTTRGFENPIVNNGELLVDGTRPHPSDPTSYTPRQSAIQHYLGQPTVGKTLQVEVSKFAVSTDPALAQTYRAFLIQLGERQTLATTASGFFEGLWTFDLGVPESTDVGSNPLLLARVYGATMHLRAVRLTSSPADSFTVISSANPMIAGTSLRFQLKLAKPSQDATVSIYGVNGSNPTVNLPFDLIQLTSKDKGRTWEGAVKVPAAAVAGEPYAGGSVVFACSLVGGAYPRILTTLPIALGIAKEAAK